MKKQIIFLCETYYHLFVTYSYLNEMDELNYPYKIIWMGDSSLNFTENQLKHLILFSRPKNKKFFNNYINFLHFKLIVNRMFTKANDVEYRLFLYTDNNPYNRYLINKSLNYPNTKIILIEEGLGLYHTILQKKSMIFKIVYLLLGIPKPFFIGIGENEQVHSIICHDINLLPLEKIQNKIIIKQSNLFTETNRKLFLSLFDQVNLLANYKCDYLYIGQPLIEVGISEEEEINQIRNIFSVIPKDKKIVLKPHPRDRMNKYESLTNIQNVELFDLNLSKLPAELVVEFLDNPIILTAFSSVGMQLGKHIKTLYLFKFFHIKHEFLENNIRNFKENSYIIDNLSDIIAICNTGNATNHIEIDEPRDDLFYIKSLMK